MSIVSGPEATPPMVFENIQVLPGQRFSPTRSWPVIGGPIWPDWARDTWAMHLLAGKPRHGILPEPLDDVPERLVGGAIWGGFVRSHFGHLVSELMTRLPYVAASDRSEPILIVALPGEVENGAFETIAAWFGIPFDRFRIVDRPLVVDRLSVWPQGEHLRDKGPRQGYLEILEANTFRQNIKAIKSDLLYVGREGLIAKGKGVMAGESYLISRLKRKGIAVLDPARTPLREQLSMYLGARRIVFAEGSAQHGRQLLGRVADQKVYVLNRRPGERTARRSLAARCRRLSYIEVTDRLACPVHVDGRKVASRALSFYDPQELASAFRDLGVDMADDWSDHDFQAHQDRDVDLWIGKLIEHKRFIDIPATKVAVEPVIDPGRFAGWTQ